jgi:hypothetical protein
MRHFPLGVTAACVLVLVMVAAAMPSERPTEMSFEEFEVEK